jgi:hypothetical protein
MYHGTVRQGTPRERAEHPPAVGSGRGAVNVYASAVADVPTVSRGYGFAVLLER